MSNVTNFPHKKSSIEEILELNTQKEDIESIFVLTVEDGMPMVSYSEFDAPELLLLLEMVRDDIKEQLYGG